MRMQITGGVMYIALHYNLTDIIVNEISSPILK